MYVANFSWFDIVVKPVHLCSCFFFGESFVKKSVVDKSSVSALGDCRDSLGEWVSLFSSKSGVVYADARLEASEWKAASSLNGDPKMADCDSSASLGVRIITRKKGCLSAAGYAGAILGAGFKSSLKKNLDSLFSDALKSALRNSELKSVLKARYGGFAANARDSLLAEIDVCVDTVKAGFVKNPSDADLEDLGKRVNDCSKEVAGVAGIASNVVSGAVGLERQIFASSEGALIDQERALCEAFVYVAAKGKGMETYYDSLGSYAGLEVFDGKNNLGKTLEDFALYVANGTVEVSNAPAFGKVEKSAVVITDPAYNALLCHEITGHPSEADRALKREAAWAGRAWWFRGMDDNEFGKIVASESVSVFSDPGLVGGYGFYKYDDEGTPAKKVFNIENGVLKCFLNSRETALILGEEPNGGMRAANACMVPLVRMNNTCFASGDWGKDEIFEETKKGYYAVGQKTPSISETRGNFRISCWKLYSIENGEPKQLYRMGSLSADSASFLKGIDAVGNDFGLYNIPNCGKGTPMQVMKVGNGGPHLRSKAIVCGASEVNGLDGNAEGGI